ncbi:uncharacterized protein MKZ38_008809 [Zalerion maritima]|uniref:TeaA receptor TeaR n=1 Tax=Zalerion maritima TaxID=339359 RepID=A0AAD5RGQ2_9PEZI|nr:uncharacterized protein MKZ38_008809 [Zalerion maritima]
MTIAAMSPSHALTTLTPPTSSHGNESSWTYSTDRLENSSLREKQSSLHTSSSRAPLVSQNGNSYASNHFTSTDPTARKIASTDQLARAARAEETGHLSSPYVDSNQEDGTPADSTKSMHYGKTVSSNGPIGDFYAEDPNDPNSHWIHRDKLAKIENEELQAAGFILPKGRASSKARQRDRSVENVTRSRKNSKTAEVGTQDITVPSWDLRLPEEVSANDYFVSGGAKGGSRIPVAKTSPLPIREQHLDRDAPVHKKRDGSPDTSVLRYQNARSRSASASIKADTTPPSKSAGLTPAKRSTTESESPKKATTLGTRKPSTKSTSGRPKTRSGPNRGSMSGERPSTRSGELSGGSGSKQMEGDPPWMVSAYIPDPRLPPDQQLLPTVAKRLQQEKMEREGKFGSIYDKEFRPLTEEGFNKPPEGIVDLPSLSPPQGDIEKTGREWPLKEIDPNAKTPSSPSKAGGYSTMPKIQDKAHMSPMPSPRSPLNPPTTNQINTQQVVRVPEEPQEEPQKKGCGCCIVM